MILYGLPYIIIFHNACKGDYLNKHGTLASGNAPQVSRGIVLTIISIRTGFAESHLQGEGFTIPHHEDADFLSWLELE